jgi:hypothetical protein
VHGDRSIEWAAEDEGMVGTSSTGYVGSSCSGGAGTGLKFTM